MHSKRCIPVHKENKLFFSKKNLDSLLNVRDNFVSQSTLEVVKRFFFGGCNRGLLANRSAIICEGMYPAIKWEELSDSISWFSWWLLQYTHFKISWAVWKSQTWKTLRFTTKLFFTANKIVWQRQNNKPHTCIDKCNWTEIPKTNPPHMGKLFKDIRAIQWEKEYHFNK